MSELEAKHNSMMKNHLLYDIVGRPIEEQKIILEQTIKVALELLQNVSK